jgi:Leucine-rich repeat (LRR) protein
VTTSPKNKPQRLKIPPDIETKVLTLSRRRCCLCFGLNGDFGEKKGQIAHLDHDRTNNKLENLAFLCLEHHDSYDSKTSQSKGIKEKEVKNYREELYYHIMTKLPFEGAEKEQLKSLWKRIASGDFKNNNYSERLKQTFTTIDQTEAEYFNKLANFIWCDKDKKNFYLIYNDDILAYLKEKYDLTTTAFQSLADFNLIDNTPKAVILHKGKSALLQYQSHGYCFTTDDLDVYIQVKPLTRLGKELYELCEPQFKLDYLDCVLYSEGDKINIASSSFNRPPRPLVEEIEKQIAKELNKNSDELTDDDFQQITEITLYHSNRNNNIEKLVNLKRVTFLGITTKLLEKVSHMKSVEFIIFDYCCIPDISILRNLKNLKHLSFRHVNNFDLNILADWETVTDIGFEMRKGVPNFTPLSKVPNLKLLGFCAMEIDDISFISGIPNLEDIILNQTLVTNLRPFEKLDKVKSIYLSMTKVTELDGLQSLTPLQNLDLHSTKVSDISKLKNCINIKKLNLSYTKVNDIQPLNKMRNLEELFLTSTKVNDISVLKSLVNLKKLRLNNIPASDWAPLTGLINLEELDLSGNDIKDFSFISNMKSLRRLNLQKAKISDIEPLSQLTELDSINLNNVEFPSLSTIQKLSVKELSLQKAKTSGYEFLSTIKLLETLKIDDPHANVNFLETLSSLKNLFLYNIQIQSFKLLLNLKELERLTVANVPAKDYEVLKDLKNLTSLSTDSAMKELIQLRITCPELTISGNGWVDRRSISNF